MAILLNLVKCIIVYIASHIYNLNIYLRIVFIHQCYFSSFIFKITIRLLTLLYTDLHVIF